MQVSNLVEDAQAGKALKGPTSSSATTPLSPTTAHAIFAATVSVAAAHVWSGRLGPDSSLLHCLQLACSSPIAHTGS